MWSKIGRALPYAMLYTLSVGVVGLFNLLTVDPKDILNDATFWYRIVTQNTANILVLIATIMIFDNRLEESYEDYLRLNGIVKNSVRSDLEADFPEWIFLTNKKLKKAQYKAIINRVIAKQERRASIKNLHIWYEGTDEEKKSNRYCRRRAKLERLISDEYLDKRIVYIKVDYDEIDRTFIETGELKRNSREHKKQDSVNRRVRDLGPNFLFGTAFTVLFFGFSYKTNMMSAEFWYQLAFSLLMLFWQFFVGMFYSKNYMKRVKMVDLQTRFDIIKEYLTWKLTKSKEVLNGD